MQKIIALTKTQIFRFSTDTVMVFVYFFISIAVLRLPAVIGIVPPTAMRLLITRLATGFTMLSLLLISSNMICWLRQRL